MPVYNVRAITASKGSECLFPPKAAKGSECLFPPEGSGNGEEGAGKRHSDPGFRAPACRHHQWLSYPRSSTGVATPIQVLPKTWLDTLLMFSSTP